MSDTMSDPIMKAYNAGKVEWPALRLNANDKKTLVTEMEKLAGKILKSLPAATVPHGWQPSSTFFKSASHRVIKDPEELKLHYVLETMLKKSATPGEKKLAKLFAERPWIAKDYLRTVSGYEQVVKSLGKEYIIDFFKTLIQNSSYRSYNAYIDGAFSPKLEAVAQEMAETARARKVRNIRSAGSAIRNADAEIRVTEQALEKAKSPIIRVLERLLKGAGSFFKKILRRVH